MPGIGTKEPKPKKVMKLYGKIIEPDEAVIEQLRTPAYKSGEIKKPPMSGILSEDGKKLAYSREYHT